MPKIIIRTSRIDLFEWSESHAETLFRLNSDPEVIRHTGDVAFHSVVEARSLIENYDHYKKFGHGRWLCELRETGEIIGWCGLKNCSEPGRQFVDLGFRFFKDHWGHGYATESAYACLKFGFEKLNMPEIIGRAMQENVASISVLKKLGMKFWKHELDNGVTAEYYRLAPDEFAETRLAQDVDFKVEFP